MVLTASAGKVFGSLLGFIAILTVVLVAVNYWQWLLLAVGIAVLIQVPAFLRDRAGDKALQEKIDRIEETRR